MRFLIFKARNSYCITSLFSKLVASAASLDGTSQPTLLSLLGSSSSKSVKMTTPVEVSKPCKFFKARNSYCITSLFSKLVASAASLDGTSQPTLLSLCLKSDNMASKDSTAHAIDPSYLSEGTQVYYTAVQSDALKDSSPIEVSDSPSKHEHMWIHNLNLTVKDKQIVDGNGWCNDQVTDISLVRACSVIGVLY